MSASTLIRQSLAFARLDALEERAYPLAAIFRYVSITLPVVVQFFVARLVVGGDDVGGDYFTFAVIGLAMGAALQRSLSDFGGRLQNLQNSGALETVLMEPFPWTLVPGAMSLWHAAAAAVSTFLALGVGVALGAEISIAGLLPFVLVLVLTVMSGATIGIASAAALLLTKRSSPLLTLYGFVATIFGGAVFPLSLLPDWLRPVSAVVPHSYAIDAAREVLMTTPPTSSRGLGAAVLGLAIIVVVLLPASLMLFNRALSVARRRGELGAY